MDKNERVATNKWINVIKKSDDYTLPVGMRAQVFVSTDNNGNTVEWFMDSCGNWELVKPRLKSGIIGYENGS